MSTGTPTIVVGSGKGGVGKSIVSILLATALAARGHRMLLVDGDQNLGNLHVLLDRPAGAPMESLLHGDTMPPDLVVHVAENLWLLPAVSGAESLQALDPLGRARLHHRMSDVFSDFDLVVVDAGAGLDGVIRVAAGHATRLLVVTAPEPTALTDAYALLKLVHLQNRELPVDVLVNRCSHAEEGRRAHARLATACGLFLKRGVRYVGALPEDEALRLAMRNPSRLLATVARTTAAHIVSDTVLPYLELPQQARSAG